MSAFDRLRVAKNCPASWSSMRGDDKVRHCSLCNRKVYNFANMTRAEAMRIVEESGGNLCARFYLRSDGKIMTKECGRAVKARTKIYAWCAGVLGIFGLSILFTPVYAGQIRSPELMLKSDLRQIENLDKTLAEPMSEDDRGALEQIRLSKYEQLRDAVKRYLKMQKM